MYKRSVDIFKRSLVQACEEAIVYKTCKKARDCVVDAGIKIDEKRKVYKKFLQRYVPEGVNGRRRR